MNEQLISTGKWLEERKAHYAKELVKESLKKDPNGLSKEMLAFASMLGGKTLTEEAVLNEMENLPDTQLRALVVALCELVTKLHPEIEQ